VTTSPVVVADSGPLIALSIIGQLDDARARRVAERFGIRRIGTLGILRRAKNAGLVEQVGPFARQLRANGIYIRQSLINAVLRDVGEVEGL